MEMSVLQKCVFTIYEAKDPSPSLKMKAKTAERGQVNQVRDQVSSVSSTLQPTFQGKGRIWQIV